MQPYGKKCRTYVPFAQRLSSAADTVGVLVRGDARCAAMWQFGEPLRYL